MSVLSYTSELTPHTYLESYVSKNPVTVDLVEGSRLKPFHCSDARGGGYMVIEAELKDVSVLEQKRDTGLKVTDGFI